MCVCVCGSGLTFQVLKILILWDFKKEQSLIWLKVVQFDNILSLSFIGRWRFVCKGMRIKFTL